MSKITVPANPINGVTVQKTVMVNATAINGNTTSSVVNLVPGKTVQIKAFPGMHNFDIDYGIKSPLKNVAAQNIKLKRKGADLEIWFYGDDEPSGITILDFFSEAYDSTLTDQFGNDLVATKLVSGPLSPDVLEPADTDLASIDDPAGPAAALNHKAYRVAANTNDGFASDMIDASAVVDWSGEAFTETASATSADSLFLPIVGGVALLAAVAGGGGGGTSGSGAVSQEEAVRQISQAAESNSASDQTPSASIYTSAGVAGVDASNVGAINSALNSAAVNGAATDTTAKIQKVADAYNKVLTAADGNPVDNTSGSAIPSAADYSAIGVTGLTAPGAKLLSDVVDNKTKQEVDAVGEVQVIADAANAVSGYKGPSSGTPAPTIAQLNAVAGGNFVTDSNLSAVLAGLAANNSAGTPVTQKVLLGLAGVNTANNPPSGTDGSATGPEDAVVLLMPERFGFTDSDNDTMAGLIVNSLPNKGTLFLDANDDGVVNAGEQVIDGQSVKAVDLAAGRLKFVGVKDASGSPYTSFTFQVFDNSTGTAAQTTDQSPNTMAINLTPAYDAPTLVVPGNVNVTTDTYLVTGYRVVDADGTDATRTVKFTMTSTLGTLTVPDAGGLTITGQGTVAISITGTVTAVNAALTTGLTWNGDATKSTVLQSAVIDMAPSAAPVVIDLNGDGQIGFEQIGHAITGENLVAWVAPEDGVLFWDKHGDGTVRDSSQWRFTDYGGATDLEGLTILADANLDGILDAGDKLFGDLSVWQDTNTDGLATANEVKTLEQLGIVSLKLTSDGVQSHPITGVHVHGSTHATTITGDLLRVMDASFDRVL